MLFLIIGELLDYIYNMNQDKEHTIEPLRDMETIIPILGKITILGGLSEEEMNILFKKMSKTLYRKGETIFGEGRRIFVHIYCQKRAC